MKFFFNGVLHGEHGKLNFTKAEAELCWMRCCFIVYLITPSYMKVFQVQEKCFCNMILK